jgi:outer membrane murein-binding lipoprotein Lpp
MKFKAITAIIVLSLVVASLSIAGCTSSTNSNQVASSTPQVSSVAQKATIEHDPVLAAIVAQIQKGSNHTLNITWDSSSDRAVGSVTDANNQTIRFSVVTVNESWVDSNGTERSISAMFDNQGSVENATKEFESGVLSANHDTNGAADDLHETHYALGSITTALGHAPATVKDITYHYSGSPVAYYEYIQYDNIFVVIRQNLGINDPSAPVTKFPTYHPLPPQTIP